ncbi:mitochondrial and cytoplasmic histidine-tRNA ligase Hrs1 [Syncephalis plumigaleata]|nr:mitochondrial and cytoplasmic histidine-tRNA ligase Hrs1 [Syncephalis plumigaleata]
MSELTGTPVGTDGSGKNKGKSMTLKTPKGTRDYTEHEMAIRDHMFSVIRQVFKRHGGVTIDTPVFELKEVLSGKYGEDSKLIYDLEDQGGEKCSLRYDLTVPFARFLAMNGNAYQNIKRYQIGKVYRRDQPAMTKGRMREFYQCDFDIAGTYESMVPDAEVLRIAVEALTELNVGPFFIKLNHRKILDGIFTVCGVPEASIRPISSAVDKLDKLPWEEVRREMTEEKHLDPVVADRIGDYVKLKGGRELLSKLRADAELSSNEKAKEGLDDMETLFNYLDIFNVLDKISFDMSLARGLDYYTGIIYEAVLVQAEEQKRVAKPADSKFENSEESVGIGSIAAGGRYDELVGMFAAAAGGKKSSSAQRIPCVGVSLGVERIFSVLLNRADAQQHRANEAEVMVISVFEGLLEERMRICSELWQHDIKAEFMYKKKPKAAAQFNACNKDRIPLAVIIGGEEVANGMVRIKDMRISSEERDEKDQGTLVARSDMVNELKRLLGRA